MRTGGSEPRRPGAKLWRSSTDWTLARRPRLRRVMRAQGTRRVPRRPNAATRPNRFGLTSRQMEILDLLAEGCRNSEMAERSSIAPKTAEHHVAAVLAKLDVESRRAAVKFACTRQLIAQ